MAPVPRTASSAALEPVEEAELPLPPLPASSAALEPVEEAELPLPPLPASLAGFEDVVGSFGVASAEFAPFFPVELLYNGSAGVTS